MAKLSFNHQSTEFPNRLLEIKKEPHGGVQLYLYEKTKNFFGDCFSIKTVWRIRIEKLEFADTALYGVTTLILFDTLAEDVEVVLAGAAKNKASTLK